MQTGEKIKERREKKGLSQKALADRFEGAINQAQISRWELGKSKPLYRNIVRLAEILDCDAGELIGDDGTAEALKADPDEKVSILNQKIFEKNQKIRELEDQVLDLMQQVEDLKKKTDASSLKNQLLKLQQENEKLKKVLSKKLLEDAMKEV